MQNKNCVILVKRTFQISIDTFSQYVRNTSILFVFYPSEMFASRDFIT